ncbi:MAG: response regulator [bacterium]|jgi:DNA-binding NarL/FixJ family response regulator
MEKDIKVSVVEDNHFIRTALEQIIQGVSGYEMVGVFASGEEAIVKIPEVAPDVVLMDINMGKMNGIEAVKILKSQCPNILFMMCTVYEDDEKIFEALAAGASGYILKKTKPAEMISAIKDLYEGGAPMTSQIASKVVASFRKKEEVRDELIEKLSSREYEILELLVKGRLYKEIAVALVISQETVRKHVYNVYKKLHINNRVEAYNKYYNSRKTP